MKLSYIFYSLLILLIISVGCSREEPVVTKSAYIWGQINVDPQIDPSGDYSGINILSTVSTGGDRVDTLFHAVTDSTGFFEGDATFESNDIYTVLITRNRNTFGLVNLVFADGDSIEITATLPNVNQTIEISSRENQLLETLDRIERNFNRVVNFINAGVITGDSVRIEVEKWSDIYWEIYEENPRTHVAKLSGESSASILRGFNDSLMVARSNEILENYGHLSSGIRATLADYYGETEGLSGILNFYNQLEERDIPESSRIQIKMERIEVLYDSSRADDALRLLTEFEQQFANNEHALQWAENIKFDLEFLSPGSQFPSIGFRTTEGDSVNTGNLRGTPLLIEITRFDNMLYQQQYDRTVAIYQIYRNFGLEIYTIPVATNRIMLDAFFEERNKLWSIAEPGSFNVEELIEQLNLTMVPTRFLIDSDGTIIRRYIGNEYDDIVRGLQRITTLTEQHTN